MTQGYIESITLVRPLSHHDFPTASLPADGVALSVFWAASMDILEDDVCAQFVAMSACAFPWRWIVHRMPMKRGSLWVFSVEYCCNHLEEAWGKLQWGCYPMRTLGCCAQRLFRTQVWQFVYLAQYSNGIREPTVQKASQKLDARLVPSAATHHPSRNETCGAHPHLERWFAIV